MYDLEFYWKGFVPTLSNYDMVTCDSDSVFGIILILFGSQKTSLISSLWILMMSLKLWEKER